MATGAPDWWIQGIIPMRFVNLSDTPGDYVGHAGLVPEVNVAEDALEWLDAEIDDHSARHELGGADPIAGLLTLLYDHEARHRSGGADALAHANLNPQTSDHHVRYADAEARAAIDDIFGSDGKADKEIDLDGNFLINGHYRIDVVTTSGRTYLLQNIYRDGANWKYSNNGAGIAIQLKTDTGDMYIMMAAVGVKDAVAALSTKFHLDISGNLASVLTYDGISLSAPVVVDSHGFSPMDDRNDWYHDTDCLMNRSALTLQGYVSNVKLPHGKTVDEMTLFGYRDDAAAAMLLYLIRSDLAGNVSTMGQASGNWTSGWSSNTDTTIVNGLIDLDTYAYHLLLTLDPNDSVNDVRFSGAKIVFA